MEVEGRMSSRNPIELLVEKNHTENSEQGHEDMDKLQQPTR